MDGFINVKNPPFGLTIANGDGCKDDTSALQDAFDALSRSGASGSTCGEPGSQGEWAPYYAGIYVPAGVYRITQPINIPQLVNCRIFGEGGRGGQREPGTGLPYGSVIQMTEDNAPIFRFANTDTQGVTIERLGFRWANQQEPPPTWVPDLEVYERQPSTYVDPGAVALLFTAGAGSSTDEQFYHFTIRDCHFEQGWRGIAIDDADDTKQIAVWETHIERCSFHRMRGAAVSLVNHPDHVIGMPSNALTDCFIENYSHVGSSLAQEYARRNVEPQVRLGAQRAMRVDGLDAEGSKTTVLYASDSQVSIRDLYLEHVKIGYPLRDGGILVGLLGKPYAQVLSLYGGAYSVEGLHVDGTINAMDPGSFAPTFSSLIFAVDGASVVASSPQSRPVLNPTTADLDEAGGFHIERGSSYVFHTNTFGGRTPARFRATGELRLEASSRTSHKLSLYINEGEYDGTTTADDLAQRVEREPRVVRLELPFPSIPAGAVRANGSILLTDPFPGARVGDLVTLAPPASFPAQCIAFGVVVADDGVEVRVMNGGSSAVTPLTGVWTVAYGRGGSNVLHAA